MGEIVAGMLLGASPLGSASSAFHDAVFGAHATQGLTQLSDLGLVLLMFETGLHLNAELGRRRSAIFPAITIAIVGICVPAVAGVTCAFASRAALAPHVPVVPYVLFCGVTLSVSAMPVMVRIIDDLNLRMHHVAQAALAAAMISDAAGLVRADCNHRAVPRGQAVGGRAAQPGTYRGLPVRAEVRGTRDRTPA